MTASVGGTTGPGGAEFTDLLGMVTVEERLAALLRQAARGIDHADAIDDENRSEIYTIIQAMQSDTQEHCNIVGQWVSDRKQEPGNA